jgi:single-stranded-DNA-specific exonuclease
LVAETAERFGLSRIMAGVVLRRVNPPTPDNIRAYLKPSLNALIPPWRMDGMDKAAERLARAVESRQPAVVYGDYDTDGVTACALMIRACRAVGYSLGYRLPSRFDDGYGISPDFPGQAAAEGVKLVLTVDCGTSEHENIGRLAENGIDVIVTDHHEPGDRELPRAAHAILNPKRNDSSYPFRDLTGVGVAFKLAWALYEKLSGSARIESRLRETLLSLLPLAAIGTIADVAPLVNENRAIVAWGLRAIRDALPGIAALIGVSRLENAELNARDVAFSLSPRLNAAGRMGSADLSLKLLIEDDPAAARLFAEELDRHNTDRQEKCRDILEEASSQAEKNHDPALDAAILVANDGWHEGVIGIVAGRLSEKFAKPAAVVSFPAEQERGRGSARSVDGFNLYRILANSSSHLLAFGGHELAAGFTVARDRLEAFRQAFLEECRILAERDNLLPTLNLDAEISLSDLNHRLLEELELLRPVGQGNPEPAFLIRRVRLAGSARLMGKDQRHFQFNVSQAGICYRAVVFNRLELLPLIEDLAAGRKPLDIVCTPTLNRFFSPPRLELQVGDAKAAGAD